MTTATDRARAPERRGPETTTPTEASAASGSVQLKASLQGKSFAEQEAALSPSASVQMHGGGDAGSVDVHAAAARGTTGSGGALPHGGTIQKAFGSHDVSGVQAYTGGAAKEATSAMGASAYATGDKIAFGGAPDLHTAAHEAAHVVQQRAGVSLSGGVGQVGDSYERHADQVADAVIAGKSAEPILAQMAGAGGGGGVQQRALQFIRRGLTTKEAIKQIQADGWTLASQKGSHKQFTHGTKPGKVTIADHGGKSEIPLGTQKSIEAQAGITLE